VTRNLSKDQGITVVGYVAERRLNNIGRNIAELDSWWIGMDHLLIQSPKTLTVLSTGVRLVKLMNCGG
jgi:hypothetical protein